MGRLATAPVHNRESKETGPVQEPAGLSRRFFAYLIDWYVGGLAVALPVSSVSMKLFGTVTNQNIMSFGTPYSLIAGGLGLLAAFLYYAAVPMFCWKGQTLGKRWLKIRIVGKGGEDASLGNLFLRQLIGIILVEGSLVSASTILHQVLSVLTGQNLVTVLMYAGMAVSIVSAVMVLIKDHRAIHDYIGGTKVISWK